MTSKNLVLFAHSAKQRLPSSVPRRWGMAALGVSSGRGRGASRQKRKWVGAFSAPQRQWRAASACLKRRWYAEKSPWPERAARRWWRSRRGSESSFGIRSPRRAREEYMRSWSESQERQETSASIQSCSLVERRTAAKVARGRALLRGRSAASRAAASATTLPGIPQCPGHQRKETCPCSAYSSRPGLAACTCFGAHP